MTYFIIYVIISIIICIFLTTKDYAEAKDIFGDAPLFNLIEPTDFLKDNLIKSVIWPLYLCYVILGLIIKFICYKMF